MKYFLSVILFSLLICSSCQQQVEYYIKNKSVIDSKQLSQNLMYGGMRSYQGSPRFQMHMIEAQKHSQSEGILDREIGVPYLKRGFAKEFYHHYDLAVSKDPLGWQGWRGYLYLYFYRDYERALNDFVIADSLSPSIVDYPQNININYMKGICHLQMGNFEKALMFFDEYMEYEKEEIGEIYISSRAYLVKGIAYYKAGIFEKSLQTFKYGIKMDPENANLRYWYAKLLLEKNDTKGAQKQLTEAKKLFKSGAHNTRSYVEEFFQIYMSDLTALESKLQGQ